jgi:hypothetical protein
MFQTVSSTPLLQYKIKIGSSCGGSHHDNECKNNWLRTRTMAQHTYAGKYRLKLLRHIVADGLKTLLLTNQWNIGLRAVGISWIKQSTADIKK